jgi:hypothetical protein
MDPGDDRVDLMLDKFAKHGRQPIQRSAGGGVQDRDALPVDAGVFGEPLPELDNQSVFWTSSDEWCCDHWKPALWPRWLPHHKRQRHRP